MVLSECRWFDGGQSNHCGWVPGWSGWELAIIK